MSSSKSKAKPKRDESSDSETGSESSDAPVTKKPVAKKVVKSESESESESSDEQQKKKVAKKPAAKKQASGSDESSEDDVKSKGKKSQPAKKKKAESSSEESSEEESESSDARSKSKKKPAAKAPAKAAAKKKKQESSSEDESESESEESDRPAAKGGKAAPAGKKPAAPAKGAQPQQQQQKAGKGKGGKGAAAMADEDLDAMLAKLAVTTEAKAAEPAKPAAAEPAKPAEAAAAAEAAEGEVEGKEGKKLSKAQLKKQKEKAKKAAQTAGGDAAAAAPAAGDAAAAGAEKPAAAAAGKKDDKKKKPTGALAAVRDALARQKEAEERFKREEEERIRKEEEAEQRRLDELARIEAEKKRIKEEKKKEKEELKRKGLLLTKAQQEKRDRARHLIEQVEAERKKAKEAAAAAAAATAAPSTTTEGAAAPSPAAEAEKPAEAAGAAAPAGDKAKKDQKKKKGGKSVLNAKQQQLKEEADRIRREQEAAEAAARAAAAAAAEAEDDWDAEPAEPAAATPAAGAGEDAGSWEEEEEAGDDADAAKKKAEQDKARKDAAEKKKAADKKAKEEADKKAKDEAEKKKAAAAAPGGKKDAKKGGKADTRELRSPIVCILGHVDTGKTKILDKIRRTNVQDHEAGGITQQIGATYFPIERVKEQTAELVATLEDPIDFKLPGLLVIDTPGHESFTNLRSRGSSLCDMAILVVDIMHGLEPQTLESIRLLRERKTPFVVALNKIDRCYSWKATPNSPAQATLANQAEHVVNEFERRAQETMTLFAEQGLNTALYWKNPDPRSYVSLVPTSAITGEGIPDLLCLLMRLCQTYLSSRMAYQSSLQCTVLEVKAVEGLGTTIDVVLVNGVLRKGDTIVVCGLNGPIVTTIRSLLTPQPCTELRVKGEYIQHAEVKAAMGVKIAANGMETAVAGSQLLVAGPKDDLERLKDDVQDDLGTILSRVDKSGHGVYVQASTLGSLEALLTFLEEKKIPVSAIGIGPVHKKDVMRASVMLQHRKEFATILAFDVKVDPEAQKLAADMGVRVFTAEIIYHLFDRCMEYFEEIKKQRREAAKEEAVFPCVLKIFSDHVYRIKDPIVVGVQVMEGVLKIGTPLVVPDKQNLFIGRVESIQDNKTDVTEAKKGKEVCIKIASPDAATNIYYGRHFDHSNQIVSQLTRGSIDRLKEHFKDEMTDEYWRLVVKLKKTFNIT